MVGARGVVEYLSVRCRRAPKRREAARILGVGGGMGMGGSGGGQWSLPRDTARVAELRKTPPS